MEQTVSAADANRRFSKILRGVKDGARYIVTSHGAPVAMIVPSDHLALDRTHAKAPLIARLRAQPVQILDEAWSRDGLYER